MFSTYTQQRIEIYTDNTTAYQNVANLGEIPSNLVAKKSRHKHHLIGAIWQINLLEII